MTEGQPVTEPGDDAENGSTSLEGLVQDLVALEDAQRVNSDSHGSAEMEALSTEFRSNLRFLVADQLRNDRHVGDVGALLEAALDMWVGPQ